MTIEKLFKMDKRLAADLDIFKRKLGYKMHSKILKSFTTFSECYKLPKNRLKIEKILLLKLSDFPPPIIVIILEYFLISKEEIVLNVLKSLTDEHLKEMLAQGPPGMKAVAIESSYSGNVLLNWATGYGYLGLMCFLIQAGVNINEYNRLGSCAASVSVDCNQPEALELLINKNIDINVDINMPLKDWKETIIHRAAFHGNDIITTLLLKKKANVNIQTSRGNTPLHRIAELIHNPLGNVKRYSEVVRLLVEAKADTTIKNENGETAFEYAKRLRKNYECSEFLKSSSELKKIFNPFASSICMFGGSEKQKRKIELNHKQKRMKPNIEKNVGELKQNTSDNSTTYCGMCLGF